MGAVVPIFRDAIRHLTSAPGHAATLIVTLSLAIGATTALFSVVYGVLLRPLPYPEADRLVVVEAAKQFASTIVPGSFSAAELPDWRDHNGAFAAIAMHGADALTFSRI